MSRYLELWKPVRRFVLPFGILCAGVVIGWCMAEQLASSAPDVCDDETHLWVDTQMRPIRLSCTIRNRSTKQELHTIQYHWDWEHYRRFLDSNDIVFEKQNGRTEPFAFYGGMQKASFVETTETDIQGNKLWSADIGDALLSVPSSDK